jgi:ATP-dependent DNA ligase
MILALQPPFPPMEALSVDEVPQGKHWQYEPKWEWLPLSGISQ